MPTAKKVLILALDSLNAEALAPHLAAGRLPALQRLLAPAASGILDSTLPAHTAAAWTTLATGKHPGVHGITNFRRFDPRTQQRRLNSNQDLAHQTVWQILDAAGLRVGVVGQPQSYPLRELRHGFAVSGFETPSTACQFTWPLELKTEVLQQVPQFAFRSERVRAPDAGKDWSQWDDFVAGLDALSGENEHAHALNLYLARTRPWDVLFLYYQAPDPLFHKAWRWCDPETRDTDPRRAERIDRFFVRLDAMVAEILALPAAQDALVVLCSDHGHGPVHTLLHVNGLLADLNFLRRGGLLAQARSAWKRATGQRREKGFGLALDWGNTRAYMPFEAIAGFIFLNQQGREPCGLVPEGQAPAVIQELSAALLAQTDPRSGRPLFDAVKTPAEAYSRRAGADFPDLFVLPARGINLVRKFSFGSALEIPAEQHKGTHRPEGFFAFSGPGVRVTPQARASIADLAPTILATLGLPVPSDMTGIVRTEFFTAPLNVRTSAPAVTGTPAAAGGEVYSAAEQALVEQRLADLGYVD